MARMTPALATRRVTRTLATLATLATLTTLATLATVATPARATVLTLLKFGVYNAGDTSCSDMVLYSVPVMAQTGGTCSPNDSDGLTHVKIECGASVTSYSDNTCSDDEWLVTNFTCFSMDLASGDTVPAMATCFDVDDSMVFSRTYYSDDACSSPRKKNPAASTLFVADGNCYKVNAPEGFYKAVRQYSDVYADTVFTISYHNSTDCSDAVQTVEDVPIGGMNTCKTTAYQGLPAAYYDLAPYSPPDLASTDAPVVAPSVGPNQVTLFKIDMYDSSDTSCSNTALSGLPLIARTGGGCSPTNIGGSHAKVVCGASVKTYTDDACQDDETIITDFTCIAQDTFGLPTKATCFDVDADLVFSMTYFEDTMCTGTADSGTTVILVADGNCYLSMVSRASYTASREYSSYYSDYVFNVSYHASPDCSGEVVLEEQIPIGGNSTCRPTVVGGSPASYTLLTPYSPPDFTPTGSPVVAPSVSPTPPPSDMPSTSPTESPSPSPSRSPTTPTKSPTSRSPTSRSPTSLSPTTKSPTSPSPTSTSKPTTAVPTNKPTVNPYSLAKSVFVSYQSYGDPHNAYNISRVYDATASYPVVAGDVVTTKPGGLVEVLTSQKMFTCRQLSSGKFLTYLDVAPGTDARDVGVTIQTKTEYFVGDVVDISSNYFAGLTLTTGGSSFTYDVDLYKGASKEIIEPDLGGKTVPWTVSKVTTSKFLEDYRSGNLTIKWTPRTGLSCVYTVIINQPNLNTDLIMGYLDIYFSCSFGAGSLVNNIYGQPQCINTYRRRELDADLVANRSAVASSTCGGLGLTGDFLDACTFDLTYTNATFLANSSAAGQTTAQVAEAVRNATVTAVAEGAFNVGGAATAITARTAWAAVAALTVAAVVGGGAGM